jgi:hypothetical protein
MNFPVVGDADAYAAFGQSCANFIADVGVEGSSCYNPIRPVGILIYHAIPYLLSSEAVEQNYIVVLLNLLSLMVLLASLLVTFRNLVASADVSKHGFERLVESLIVGLVLALCVAYIPVRLSDLQSFAIFTSSLAILTQKNSRRKVLPMLVAGLMAGGAVLLKQNYIISIFFLVVFWVGFDFKEHLKTKFKYVFLYLLGVSLCLVQVAMVFQHSGALWFYEPKVMAGYDPVNAQPYVELVAYTDPIASAYVSRLQIELSEFQFIAVKFYEGITKFYLSVYLGKAPLEITPEVLEISEVKLIFMQFVLIFTALLTVATVFLKDKWVTILSFMTASSIFLSVAILHTENRYFLMTKIYCLLIMAVLLTRAVKNMRTSSGLLRE